MKISRTFSQFLRQPENLRQAQSRLSALQSQDKGNEKLYLIQLEQNRALVTQMDWLHKQWSEGNAKNLIKLQSLIHISETHCQTVDWLYQGEIADNEKLNMPLPKSFLPSGPASSTCPEIGF